jgi:hypothetical protein
MVILTGNQVHNVKSWNINFPSVICGQKCFDHKTLNIIWILIILSVLPTRGWWEVGRLTNDGTQRAGCGHGLIKILPKYVAGETKENHNMPVCIITSVPAEVKIKNLLNTNLECSRYTTLIASVLNVTSKKIMNCELWNLLPCSRRVTYRESVKYHGYVSQVTTNKPNSPTANKPYTL